MNRLTLVAKLVAKNKSILKRGGLAAIPLLALSLALAWPQRAAAACAAPSTDYGSASATTNVNSTGTYRVWSRIMAPDTNSNSYLLEVDGGSCYTVGDAALTPGTWTWVDYQNGTASSKINLNLNAGSHTLKMIGREAGVKLDRVLLVSDLACVPTGTGDNCATTADTTPPTVAMTAPTANATVSGTVNLTANATDTTGVTKVEFYVNGALKSSDTTAPYAYSWDSKTVANGNYSLMAKAYDAAGNTASDTVPVSVQNTDTQAPTAPGNVKATAASYNKVNLTWTASTDNVGVAGYWISRNGVPLDQVGVVTSYSDNSAMPNTAYTYTLTAYDAAGNNSPSSASASVTTPKAPDTEAPSAPANLSATAVSTTQINLSWTASTDNVGVSGYDVYRATGSSTTAATKVGSATSTSFGDAALSVNTKYSYYVVARDGSGNVSKPSTTVSATTQNNTPPPPTSGNGEIHGKVSGRGRHALAGVQVTVRGNGSRKIYTTNDSGAYDITGLRAGTYTVKYQKRGYSSEVVTIKVKADRSITRNITLRARN